MAACMMPVSPLRTDTAAQLQLRGGYYMQYRSDHYCHSVGTRALKPALYTIMRNVCALGGLRRDAMDLHISDAFTPCDWRQMCTAEGAWDDEEMTEVMPDPSSGLPQLSEAVQYEWMLAV